MKFINTHEGARKRRTIKGSFTMWDLIAIIVMVILLSGIWIIYARSGERGRIARCTGNLKVLGESIFAYANDHNDGIPEAAIEWGNTKTSWDVELFPYLGPGQKVTSIYDRKLDMGTVQPHFFCPSDPIQRRNPRSYAMSWRSHGLSPGQINPENWPPTPDDMTGLGLTWDKGTIILLDTNTAVAAMKNPDLLPKIKLSLLPDPAHTLLLTELIARKNVMESLSSVCVGNVGGQQKGLKGKFSKFHFGQFNYLMADGHVELLTPSEAENGNGPTGIWTIKAGD